MVKTTKKLKYRLTLMKNVIAQMEQHMIEEEVSDLEDLVKQLRKDFNKVN